MVQLSFKVFSWFCSPLYTYFLSSSLTVLSNEGKYYPKIITNKIYMQCMLQCDLDRKVNSQVVIMKKYQ